MAGTPTAIAGISTLGVQLGWAIDSSATTPPSAFTRIERINSIGGISLSTETIDASAMEDEISKYIAGRQDTGGTWEVGVNLTTDTITEIKAMITAYKGKAANDVMWIDVYSPTMKKSFFVIVEPPLHIPLPEMNQNELMVVTLTFSIVDYIGDGTGVAPTIA